MIRKITVLALACAPVPTFADISYENNINLSHKSKSGIKYSIQRRDMYGNGEWFYYHWDARVSKKAKSGLHDFGLDWRYIESNDAIENRPYGFIRFIKQLDEWQLRNRSKAELRLRDGRDNVWRYKNTSYVTRKMYSTMSLNATTEFTYDFGLNGWTSNKSTLGGIFKVGKKIKLAPYYQYQTTLGDNSISDGWWTMDLSVKF